MIDDDLPTFNLKCDPLCLPESTVCPFKSFEQCSCLHQETCIDMSMNPVQCHVSITEELIVDFCDI